MPAKLSTAAKGKEGKSMTVKIIPVREHFEVHIDGEFYCSADTLSEAKQDINNYIDAQREINER